MKDNKVLSWGLFALWVPVALIICLLRAFVYLFAKTAYRVNSGAWWVHSKTRKLGNSVGEWFHASAAFKFLREKEAVLEKKALDDWMANG